MKSIKFFGITLSILMLSWTSLASENCENYAKASAIRAYKAEIGPVQGSDGVSYLAFLIGSDQDGTTFDYVVSIGENNDEGDYWEVDYAVRVQAQPEGQKCDTLSTTKIFIRENPA